VNTDTEFYLYKLFYSYLIYYNMQFYVLLVIMFFLALGHIHYLIKLDTKYEFVASSVHRFIRHGREKDIFTI